MTSERVAKLHERLSAALDARGICETTAWREAWDDMERELIERLLSCEAGAVGDLARERLCEIVKSIRHVRSAIESKARSSETLERELDMLEGRKVRPIA